MIHDIAPDTVAVVGAGPVGLAAASHLLERGFAPVVFEAGSSVASHLESVRHVRLFSPWRYDVDGAARRLLEAAGWRSPPDEELPTAGELVDRYLAPLARLPALADAVHFDSRVTAITREGFDKVKTRGREDAPFLLRVETPQGVREHRAWAVLDATGTWGTPNPLGASGLPALGEREHAARIAYGMPDILGRERARYAGKRVLVAGAGHSAAGNLLALADLAATDAGTHGVWMVRSPRVDRAYGGGENDGLPARGALGARLKAQVDDGRLDVVAGFKARAVRELDGRLAVDGVLEGTGEFTISGIDEIIVAAGSRPDHAITGELRTRHDPWLESTEALAPLIDPNEHSCGTVRPHGHRELAQPESRFYAIGAKSYGRAPNFLLATGYEQARSVIAALAGDRVAADDVRLELPETGVCSVSFAGAATAAESCCGGPPQADSKACCAKGETERAAGGNGCNERRPAAAAACC